MRSSRPARNRSAISWLGRVVPGAFLVLAAVLTWRVSAQTYAASAAALALAAEHPEPDPTSSVALALVMVLLVLTYWLPRRGRFSGVGLVVAVGVASEVFIIGLATYAPCTQPGTSTYAPIGWVLGLFTGDFEFEGPASVCALAFSPGFELARTLGVMLTAFGALGVIWLLARHWLDRLRATHSSDVDVVAGLSAATLPLVRALVAENKSRSMRSEWIDQRPAWLGAHSAGASPGQGYAWWWLTGLRPGDLRKILKTRPKTIIVDLDPENPLIAEVRRLGALVVIGDAVDPALMRSVVTRSRALRARRVALRRLYAVDHEQPRNVDIWATARDVLSVQGLERHLVDLVPRVFVLMDDAREARQWRISQIQHLGIGLEGVDGTERPDRTPPMLISDSLTLDGIASELVVDRILPQHEWLAAHSVVPHVIIVGEGSLALTIIDELAWQLWCRFEVAHEADRGPEASQPRLARVTLCGPKAATRAAEWERLRAPWGFSASTASNAILQLFAVAADADDGEDVATRVLAAEPDAVVVFVDDRTEYAAAASRLARRFPSTRPDHVRVMLRSSQGMSSEPLVPGGLLRLVPELVCLDAHGAAIPPQDSVTRLARQQHTVYRAAHGWPVGGASVAIGRGTSATQGPWEALPEFFKEDNVRQHWQVLSWFNQHGFAWRPVSSGDTSDSDWRAVLAEVASAEYQRWAQLRTTHGWWPGAPGNRNDSARVHPDLRGWQYVDRHFNERLIESVVNRMWATGLIAVRATPSADDARPSDGRQPRRESAGQERNLHAGIPRSPT